MTDDPTRRPDGRDSGRFDPEDPTTRGARRSSGDDDVPRVVRPRRRSAADAENQRPADDRGRRREPEGRESAPRRQREPEGRPRAAERQREPEGRPQSRERRPGNGRSEERGPRPAARPRNADGPRGDSGRRNTAESGRAPQGVVEDEYVVLPGRSSTPRRILTVLLVVALIVGVGLGGMLLWASRQISPSGPPGRAIEVLTIPKGASTPSIARILSEQRIISNDRIFTFYVGLKHKGNWKAGDYVDFRENAGFDEAIRVLDAGPVPPASRVVRVQEGSRLVDALDAVANQMGNVTAEQLQATLDSGEVKSAYKPEGVASWEGLLFPDTYQFAETDTPAIILQKMATRMDQVLDSLGYDRALALSGRSAYELVTIASLIERETGQPAEERGQISRVISNRLDAGEALGIDAAVLYGLGRASGELTKADLDQDTPYNTRIHKGLPPTPIGLPGEASLRAAIEPAVGDWKYYVLTSNDPPSHFFTSSYQEFLRQKNDAQRRGVF